MTDILDKLDTITKTPSKRTSEYYFKPTLDEIMDKFATMNKDEQDQLLTEQEQDIIDKIKKLQEGGIIT